MSVCGYHLFASAHGAFWHVECELRECTLVIWQNPLTEIELLAKYHLLKTDSYPGVK
jgi:hypothetical protein